MKFVSRRVSAARLAAYVAAQAMFSFVPTHLGGPLEPRPAAPAAGELWYRGVLRERVEPRDPGADVTDAAVALVQAALAGDGGAIRALVADLTPVIQGSAASALRRRVVANGGDARQLVDDVIQDVFVELFRDRGKLLRAWDPARGKGLHGFVSLVTIQRVGAVLRSRRKNPWSEELSADAGGLDEVSGVVDPEQRIASRLAIEKLFARVRGELSPLGFLLFQRLIVDEEAIATVATALDMSTSAVQAWSSRLKRLLAKAWVDLTAEDAGETGT